MFHAPVPGRSRAGTAALFFKVILPAMFFALALVAGIGMWYLSGVGQTVNNPLLSTQGTVPPQPVPPPGQLVAQPALGAVRATDAAEPSTSIASRPESRQVVLYVAHKNDMARLVPHTITIDAAPGTRDLVDRVVNALQGPFTDPALVPTVPKGTKLLSVFQARKQLLVNLSREISMEHPGGTLGARMTVYSLVNTLIDLGLGEEVKLMIQGREELAYMDHLDLSRPLTFEASVIQGKGAAIEPEPIPSSAPIAAAARLQTATAAAAGATKPKNR